MKTDCDALVIGGGPGGATAALLLARAGWAVTLLERQEFPRRKVCGEYLSATNLPLLDQLGVGDVFRELAGPLVREVGLFAGDRVLRARLPRPNGCGWGRALSREQLDTLLLARAAEAGAEVRQPWTARTLHDLGNVYECEAYSALTGETLRLRAPVVIAAHGSWEPGGLPTQCPRTESRPDDLFGFKAHFRHSQLTDGLMPLLAFPGGYGGMVHCDGGRVSLSCCVRRDQVAQLRRGAGAGAGAAVLEHIAGACVGVRQALARAERCGMWLATGPIRPGIRVRQQRGLFQVGNAAAEAHPNVAEGISMALQAAALLAARLMYWRRAGGDVRALRVVGKAFATRWRQSFSGRLRTAAVLAHWAMRPRAVAPVLPWLRCFPALLTWGARLSGKATQVVAG